LGGTAGSRPDRVAGQAAFLSDRNVFQFFSHVLVWKGFEPAALSIPFVSPQGTEEETIFLDLV